jgi:hypothetical protein
MLVDSIVEEVRSVRRQLAAEVGGDLHRLCEEARAWEQAHPARVVVRALPESGAANGDDSAERDESKDSQTA